MSETKWRECDDPEVLAAARAAGVEVQVFAYAELAELAASINGWYPAGYTTAEQFAYAISDGVRYRVPARWQPTPEPPDGDEPGAASWPGAWGDRIERAEPPADDLRERIARAAAGGYMRVPIVALDGMYLGPPWIDVADAVLAVLPPPPDVAMHDGEPVEQWRYDALVAERDWLAARLDEADAERTKLRHKLVESMPPIPPWPGAVLSGLVDEDGEPTWLAQAPNVQGEAVRTCIDYPWFICGSDNATTPYWVEVRAPRPDPATERVQAWEAVRDGRQVVGASSPFEAHYIWPSWPNRAFIGERTMDKAVLVAPDGTVEVLREGGDQ